MGLGLGNMLRVVGLPGGSRSEAASTCGVPAQKAGGEAAVQSVALRGTDGDWVNMNNVWGASWELPNAPMGPLDMRITDPSGDTVCRGWAL
jgi:hypothetical protein